MAEFNYEQHIFRSPKFKGVVNDAVEFLNSTPAYRLPPPTLFIGAGVYVLYYIGDCELYRAISIANYKKCVLPIYVGKAVPRGWRTARIKRAQSPVLYSRLQEHHRSIVQAHNLSPSDFRCRFMILQDVEVDLVVPIEAVLIRRYKPLWNTIVDGFGNHDPGSGRYDQAPSEWDIVHPGRPWVDRLRGDPPLYEEIVKRIECHLANQSS